LPVRLLQPVRGTGTRFFSVSPLLLAAFIFVPAAAVGHLELSQESRTHILAESDLSAEATAHLATLRDGAAERAMRDSAAEALVRMAHRHAVSQAVATILSEEENAEQRPFLLRAISRTWNPPAGLFRHLVDLAERSDPQRAGPILSAIASYPSREAVSTLISFLAAERPAALRDAAAAALVRMTGRDDLRADAAAWSQWLNASRGLSDDEWKDLLAEGVWRRADRLEGDRRALGDRVAEGFRRLYIATPNEERSKLLSQMMLDTRPELRDVGLEIVSRELAAGKALDSSVADAAVRLLRAGDARIRARAAVLVSQLGAATSGPMVLEALATEKDGEAAGAMLLTLARAPDAAAAPAVLRWLNIPETRAQALDALLALQRAGELAPEHEQAIITALRQTEPTRLTASGIRLLATIGTDADRQRLTVLIEIGSTAAKTAAAEALAEHPEFVDPIILAARRDPTLFSAAIRSVMLWRPTVTGLMAIADMAATSPQEHRAGLLRLAAALPIVDLLAVAASTGSDLSLRESLLVRVVDRPMGPFLPGQEEDLATVGECMLLLAETRLALRRPDLSLIAIDALPASWPGSTSLRAVRARLIALLWTNRIPATADIDAPAAAWLDALELAIGEAHAPAILREIRARLEGKLTPEEQARLETLASALPAPAAANGPAAEGNTSSAPGLP
jgi:hypothetical protein